MADVDKLKGFVEVLGTAVRAGLLTPSLDDEQYVRKLLGLPEANADVIAEWKRSNGTRGPITLAKENAQAAADAQTDAGQTTGDETP